MVEKKATFLRIINLIKENQTDSLKNYFALQFDDDSLSFLSNLRLADSLVSKSSSQINLDSIRCIDSTLILPEKIYIYYYSLNFFRSKEHLGVIKIGFYSNVNNRPTLLLTDLEPKVDDKLVERINSDVARITDSMLSMDSSELKANKKGSRSQKR